MNESSLNLSDLDDPSQPIPSYAIVQEQMRDLIMIQESAIGNLAKTNVETLSASRDIFDATLQSKDEKIEMLQRSIAEDCVPKEKYEELVESLKRDFVPKGEFEDLQEQFQDECEKHGETQVALQDVVNQLHGSHERITTMEKDRENEQAYYNSSHNDMKMQLTEAHAKNNLLQSRLSEQVMLSDQQQEEILSLRQQLQDLEQRQQTQTQRHRQKMRESEVEKQQEAYLQRMMADREQKHKKRLK